MSRIYVLCTDPSHDPLILDTFGDGIPWTPARRTGGAREYRCVLCGGGPWRVGARRMRALAEAAARGESGAIDVTALA